MKITKKFIILLLVSIIIIATTNVLAFLYFYKSYLKIYLADKIRTNEEITLEYVNELIEKQTIDDIDKIFSDINLDFFDLLDKYKGSIPIDKDENLDIVVNYLIRKGVAPKYIQELIPKDNFEGLLKTIKDKKSLEYRFLTKLTNSIIVTNIIAFLLVIFLVFLLSRKIINPISEVTNKIKKLDVGRNFEKIYYKKNDEIGLLIHAINELNEKLMIQEDIRNRLLADISHELKTPITSIRCYLEGISDGVIELNAKNLNSIIEEMSRLVKLVNMIMEYEKFEIGENEVSLSPEKVKSIIKDIVYQYQTSIMEKSQRIEILGAEQIWMIEKDYFKQLLHNLISNFQKYAGENTTLTIKITKNSLSFKDNGNGISRDKIQFIVEKFYQGDINKTGDVGDRGIGIGLSIVDKICRLFNWSFEIVSDKDKGFELKIFTKSSH